MMKVIFLRTHTNKITAAIPDWGFRLVNYNKKKKTSSGGEKDLLHRKYTRETVWKGEVF